MPRILLSSAHIAPLVLASLGVTVTTPSIATDFPPLPEPFKITTARLAKLHDRNLAKLKEKAVEVAKEEVNAPLGQKPVTEAIDGSFLSSEKPLTSVAKKSWLGSCVIL